MTKSGPDLWQRAFERVPLSARYGADDRQTWLAMAQQLRAQFRFNFVDMKFDELATYIVCAQAALPVMRLGLTPYRHVGGVTIHGGERLAREGAAGAYSGFVELSWEIAVAGVENPQDGDNLILHEFAHAMDVDRRIIRFGALPGSDVQPARFVAEFAHAFASARVRRKEMPAELVSEYALSQPAEFFAFAIEFFFEAPNLLEQTFPWFYDQLSDLLEQDPAADQRAQVEKDIGLLLGLHAEAVALGSGTPREPRRASRRTNDDDDRRI